MQEGKIVFLSCFEEEKIANYLKCFDGKFVIGMTVTEGTENGNLSEKASTSIPLKNTEYIVAEISGFSEEEIANTAKCLKNFKPKIILTFISDNSGYTESFLEKFNSIYPKAPLVGGLASKPENEKRTFVFSKEKIISSGIVFLALKGNIEVFTNYAFGWGHFAKRFKITRCFKNRIYEIENRPVKEFFVHYLGKESINNLEAVTVSFPLMVKRNGKLVARACIGIGDDDSMIFSGDFYENEYACFGIGSERKIISEGRRLWWELTNFSPDKIILFPCIARKAFLGRNFFTETNLFLNLAEGTSGLTFGEIFPVNGKPILLNQTSTVIGLKFPHKKEKTNIREKPFHKFYPLKQKENSNFHSIIVEMLVHLANTVMKELEEKNREIKILAETDSLTRTYNRRKVFEKLEEEMIRSERYGNHLSVIIFDIDLFKSVNDTYGHLVGDKILYEIAKIVKQNIRKPDIFGRYGGEEFIIILPETNSKGATGLAEKIRKIIEKHDFGIDRKVTISLGVTSYKYGDTVDSLISRADKALYKAKEAGRNKVFYEK